MGCSLAMKRSANCSRTLLVTFMAVAIYFSVTRVGTGIAPPRLEGPEESDAEGPALVNVSWDTQGPPIPVLGVSVFVNADLLLRLLNSIDYHVEHVVVVHNGRHPLVTKVLRRLRQERPGWSILSFVENIGCAGAWNAILEAHATARYHLITNDDIAFHPGALRRFALGVERHIALLESGQGNKVILYPSHGDLYWASPPWSCFAILRQAVEVVGKFDPNFWPVYHEDYDYMVRMARAGLWQTLIPEAKVQHGWAKAYEPGMERAAKDQANSPVIDEYQRQQRRHERGSPYYALKWGVGETPGIYDAAHGYWNQTCEGAGARRTCTAKEPVLYAHPFNDSLVPLSFWTFDPALRRCLQFGTGTPCRYDHRLLPRPQLVPHDAYSPATRQWRRACSGLPCAIARWLGVTL